MRIFLFILILIVNLAYSQAKPITIDTPYLLGDEIFVSPQITLVIQAIGINEETIFYLLKDKNTGKLVVLNLNEMEILSETDPTKNPLKKFKL